MGVGLPLERWGGEADLQPITLQPGDTALIPSGIAIHIADPNLAAAHLALGQALLARRMWPFAEQALSNALRLDPSRAPSTLRALVEARRRQGKAQETLDTLGELIARRGLKQTTGPDGRPGWVWRFDPFLFRHFAFGRPLKELRMAQCPITLVRGGRSRLVTAELMQLALQHAPAGTPLMEVPDADHHVMVDQPLAFAGLLAGLVPGAQ